MTGISAFFLFALNGVLVDYADSFLESYSRAEIIYPDMNLSLKAPENLFRLEGDWPPMLKLLLFVAGNPLYFLKLFSCKVLLFLTGIRPYFSLIHNIGVASFLLASYAWGIYGIRHIYSDFLKLLVLCFFASQVLMVGCTSVNWDGRFLLPGLPFVFIVSAIGICRNLSKLDKSTSVPD